MLAQNKGYYNTQNIEKFRVAMQDYSKRILDGETFTPSISDANSKKGAVASFSTLPFITCPARCADTCGGKCYAAKLAILRGNVRNSWAKNTALAILRPDDTFAAIDAYIKYKRCRFFRFHVSGDILNADYFSRMVKLARDNAGTRFLAFTKRYEIINAWIAENGELPANVAIMFSGWSNLKCVNPYSLPETNVVARDADVDALPENHYMCGGNCFNCGCAGVGCWQAQRGETIVFKLH